VIKRIRTYLDESYSELKKVTWPTRDQVRNLTILVFAISGIFGLYIWFFDSVWSAALRFITTTF